MADKKKLVDGETSQKQQDELMRAEDDTVERVVDPTAEEAQRHADTINPPLERTAEEPHTAESKKTKDDPRKAIADGFRARRKKGDRDYIAGEMNNPALAAGQEAVDNTAKPDEEGGELAPQAQPQPSPTPEPEAQPQAQPERKIKLQIEGEVREFTEAEVRALAQKNASADKALYEAAQIRREAIQFAETARRQPQPTEADRRADQQEVEQPIPADRQAPSSKTGLTDEDLRTVFNTLQVGSEEEGLKALRDFAQKVAPQQQPVDVREAVNGVLDEREEQQSFTGATQKFLGKYPKLTDFPDVKVMISAAVETEYVKDLLKAGIPQDAIAKFDSTTLRKAHKVLRRDAQTRSFTRTPEAILTAVEATPTFKAIAPILKGPAPPLDINVDRSVRKEGVQTQPAQRTVPPRSSPQQQQTGNRHLSAVQKAQEARGQRVVS